MAIAFVINATTYTLVINTIIINIITIPTINSVIIISTNAIIISSSSSSSSMTSIIIVIITIISSLSSSSSKIKKQTAVVNIMNFRIFSLNFTFLCYTVYEVLLTTQPRIRLRAPVLLARNKQNVTVMHTSCSNVIEKHDVIILSHQVLRQ